MTASCEGGNEYLDTPKAGEISCIPQQTLALRRASTRGNMWLVR